MHAPVGVIFDFFLVAKLNFGKVPMEVCQLVFVFGALTTDVFPVLGVILCAFSETYKLWATVGQWRQLTKICHYIVLS